MKGTAADETPRPKDAASAEVNALPSSAPVPGTDVSCLNIRVIYDYLLQNAPERAEQLFDGLPDPYSQLPDQVVQLTDENNWVSSALIVHFFERAKRIVNDPEVPYQIGFDSIARRSFGYIQKFFLTTFGSPTGILKRINHVNSQFNTTKVVETIYSSPQRAVVRLHWKRDGVLSADLCRFNQGIYAAIPTLFDQGPATITEPFCQFEGDPYCQFNIRFKTSRRSLKRFIGMFATKKSQLLSALEQIENDKLVLKRKYDEVNTLNMELADKIEKLKAINAASNLVVSQENTDEILATTMNSIVHALQFDRAIIMLLNDEGTDLVFKHAAGEQPAEIEKHLHGYTIPLDRHMNILARVAKRGRPTIVQDVTEAGLRRDNLILANFGVDSFVICPLNAGEGMIGILAADRHISKRAIHEKDMQELTIFTNTIAEALHKARLREELQSSYLSTVRALVQAVEEKDAYTRGHSERVAELSVQIGAEMGMSEHDTELLRIGCLLHDVGKIGISESIVRSPKALTRSEYTEIKEHPAKGAEIVRPVKFIENFISVVRNHHERYDGTGYPDGLAGDDIPIAAQIACVADAFDAITSTRPYRTGRPVENAVAEIEADRGKQFGPAVVDAFSSLMRKKHS